jgi:glycine betaine/proline transport system substrate-binding protein
MRRTTKRVAKAVGLAAGVALVLASCGGGNIDNGASSNGDGDTPAAECDDTMDMALNPWVGYTADAYVVGRVAETQLGCKVEYKDLAEELSWAGFGSGEVDVVIENWGHPDLVKKYGPDGDGTATDFGLTGNDGIIGWYVPPWLAEEHPDILDWENLNKYADEFKTSESGDKGQLLDGDPGFVTNDEALVSNLDLNFKVVYAGSETALIQAFRKAEADKEWVIGYFYEPQWFLSEVALKKVNLPPYTDGCDADPETVACDYPPYPLNKVVSTEWAAGDSPAVDLVKNFTWTNDDQNLVAKYIAEDGMEPADAADKWIADNQDVVDGWLGK